MKNTSEANTSLNKSTDSLFVLSKAESVAWFSAYILGCAFIVAGNLLAVVLFAANKGLRKKSLFLAMNMSFADLMFGSVVLPIRIHFFGTTFQLWSGGNRSSLSIFYNILRVFFFQASLISAAFISGERFFAIYWPFKHRALSMRAYRIVIFVVWTIALLLAIGRVALDHKHVVYSWSPYTSILLFIMCGCNISIWRKLQRGSVASQQQNRASQNKRLTKTLLFVSVLALLSWLPFVIMNNLIVVLQLPISKRLYYLAGLLYYSNSFINPVVYILRIPEFRQALAFCCLRRKTAMNEERIERGDNRAANLTPTMQLRTLKTDPTQLQIASEQGNMDTKL